MKPSINPAVWGLVLLGGLLVATGGAQVYPVRWYEDQPTAAPPSFVLADGHLQFPDGTVQVTAAGSGESLGVTPSLALVLADSGIQFSDGTVQTTAAGLVPKTGQTICYDVDGFKIDCLAGIGPGQDGDLQLGSSRPNPRFSINEIGPGVPDGTVTDNLTGLVWLRNADCFGWRNWANALADANGLADPACGLADGSVAGEWRLPNRFELDSLVDIRFYSPALSNAAGTAKWREADPFFNVWSSYYWSSTTKAGYPASAWWVFFRNGSNSYIGKLASRFQYVWPVRGRHYLDPTRPPPSRSLRLVDGGIQFPDGTVQTTTAGCLVPKTGQTVCYDVDGFEIDCLTGIGPGQDGDLQFGSPWPDPRFSINEISPGVRDGTVTDNLTGLVWLRNPDCFGNQNWANALAGANGLADPACGLADGSVAGEWRLPNRFELNSLVDLAFFNPALSNAAETVFMRSVKPRYWSSTTEAGYRTSAWMENLDSGRPSPNSKESSSNYVWPVRGGHCLDPTRPPPQRLSRTSPQDLEGAKAH